MICYLKRRLSLFTFCHQREAGTPSHVTLTLYLFSAKRGKTMAERAKGRASSGYAVKAGMAPLPSPFYRSCRFPKLGDTGQGLPPPVGGELPGTPTGTESLPPVNRICLGQCLAGKRLHRITTNLMTVLKKENKTVC